MSLKRLLRPSTVAVIGGGAWCTAVIEQCRSSGFNGELIAVHPTRDDIAGAPVVRSVEELPWSPDASFIGVNRRTTIDVLRSLNAASAGGAVCFASGFEESEDVDGALLQAELLRAAGSVSLLGPNCYGYINNLDGAALWPDQHGLIPEKRGVAILTQSSNVAINLTMQQRAVPIAYVITTGNQAQQDLASVAMALLDDERVTAIGFHIEGFRNIATFEHFAQAANKKGVPIAAIKVGASDEAQLATQSHTASVAGSQAGAMALLNRFGIVCLNTLPELLETLKLLHVYRGLPGGRLASMSCSGGEASLIADAVHRHPLLSLPAIPEATAATLSEHLGPHVFKVNPLDYHTDIWRNRDAMSTVFSAMMGEPYDLTLLVLDFPRQDRCDDVDWLIAIEAAIDAKKSTAERIAIIASLVENLPEQHARTFMAHGIAPLMEFDVVLASMAAILKTGAPASLNVWLPRVNNPYIDSILVDEAAAKQALAVHGVSVPAHQVVHSAHEAQIASASLTGPWVLKGLGSAHKSEQGLVALNLTSGEAVRAAAEAMSTHASRWLLEAMVADVVVELLVGVVHDPAHGFVLTLGSGGVLTELLSDTVSLLMPVGSREITSALETLKVYPLMTGYRGKPGCNVAAIVTQVLALQTFVEHHQTSVVEVEINPLLCTTSVAIAADALLLTVGT